ncbi:MAG: hypothetical protein A3F16_03175 [Deltaproteobacteria bacterium RIFCSPHIGHO2_12_FULL_43_9]|nr:MAG: hypothetical protein A3F16_03175 [Deltaproteobacteria bacterium RIFCSPHIGHO2_12_FULL_43_9]
MALFEKIHDVNKLSQVKGSIPMEFHYTAGPGLDPFFQGLLDGKLIGSYCPECEETFFPSRLFCEKCLTEQTKTKEIPNVGIIESFTVVCEDRFGNKLKKRESLAMIRFPKVTGGLVHKLQIPVDKVKIGQKVKAIFISPKERGGKITDIAWFQGA